MSDLADIKIKNFTHIIQSIQRVLLTLNKVRAYQKKIKHCRSCFVHFITDYVFKSNLPNSSLHILSDLKSRKI